MAAYLLESSVLANSDIFDGTTWEQRRNIPEQPEIWQRRRTFNQYWQTERWCRQRRTSDARWLRLRRHILHLVLDGLKVILPNAYEVSMYGERSRRAVLEMSQRLIGSVKNPPTALVCSWTTSFLSWPQEKSTVAPDETLLLSSSSCLAWIDHGVRQHEFSYSDSLITSQEVTGLTKIPPTAFGKNGYPPTLLMTYPT
ncbi:hypothetical protein SISSUDRAFT_1123673 [Sistotremastrum suecicum HHB10207 ss-3]|uniref:Uncharacterized protein n=1 Tax=Sistotremastrum suecicum HHB10207 ss-3 TaxID=1314776 RepID=A0A165X625_9AGAM|nr:hypothetical protein SISSUDRAFT_1123673 [Sistotremastrum suecicum HHB10207 ss-3]